MTDEEKLKGLLRGFGFDPGRKPNPQVTAMLADMDRADDECIAYLTFLFLEPDKDNWWLCEGFSMCVEGGLTVFVDDFAAVSQMDQTKIYAAIGWCAVRDHPLHVDGINFGGVTV
jgi:hypothetical protein